MNQHHSSKRDRRSGVTLIELLVVILIILILAGTMFRITSLVKDKAARARTVTQIELIKSFLDTFYSFYGVYPPVDFVDWVDPTRGDKPADWSRIISDHPEVYYHGLKTGLVWYLVEDTLDGHPRWAEYEDRLQALGAITEGIISYSNDTLPTWGFEYGTIIWSNGGTSLQDAWGKNYRYKCYDPFLSFRLWSAGPDGRDGSGDDVAHDSFDE